MNRRIKIYTHADFYRLPVAGGIPNIGDTIRTNYGTGLATGYVVTLVAKKGDLYYFTCRRADEADNGNYYLNDYKLMGQRLVRGPWFPGSAGWHSNNGGLNGDGYDEIRVEKPAIQPMLFELFAGA